MARIDSYYQNLLDAIVKTGYWYKDESRDVRCKQISSVTLSLPVHDGELPILTTKKMYLKGVVGELLWFLKGSPYVGELIKDGINIWNKDAYNFYQNRYKIYPQGKPLLSEEEWLQKQKDKPKSQSGNVGANYGVQWRHFVGVEDNPSFDDKYELEFYDQIKGTIENLIKKPMGRRHIVTAWNPTELHNTALPPCHWAFELLPRPLNDEEKLLSPSCEYGLELKWHQRSVDTFLGLPFNIASYYLLLEIICQLTGMKPLGIIGDLSNVHIYEPHMMAVHEQVSKNPNKYPSAKFSFSSKAEHYFEGFRNSGDIKNLDYVLTQLTIEDFIFEYESFPAIKAEMLAPNK